MLWRWDQVLKTHPNGMRFSSFGVDGDLLATNEYFSVGGGFVVNEKTKGCLHFLSPCALIYSSVDENLFYKGVDKSVVHGARLHQSPSSAELKSDLGVEETSTAHDPNASSKLEVDQPPYPFDSGKTLLSLTQKHNVGPLKYKPKIHTDFYHS